MFHSMGTVTPAIKVQEFENFEAAATAGGGTYDSTAIAQEMLENTRSVLLQDDFQPAGSEGDHIFLAVSVAARDAVNATRILDFGGAAGLHATWSIRNYDDIEQQWAIVETPSMVEACSAIATGNVQFFATIEGALDWLGKADLVHCSGTLQYMPDPFASLSDLFAIGAQTLLIQRSALSLSRKLIELERIPLRQTAHENGSGLSQDAVVHVPVTYVDQDEFIIRLCDAYNVAYAFNGHPYKTVNETEIEYGSAYLMQRK